MVRASTEGQETDSQKQEVEDFILSKGYTRDEIEWLEVKGASARKENDKYQQMIDKIKFKLSSLGIKAVAMWHLNRLGRTEHSLSTMKEYFEKNKIQVYIKNPSLTLFNESNVVNPGDHLAWSLFAAMIKFDTDEMMEKMKRGKEQNRKDGKFVGGRGSLYGYSIGDNGYFVINPDESKVVRLIYEKYSTGNYTTKSLAHWLNDNGYKRRKCEWLSQYVRLTLISSYYTGREAIILNEKSEKVKVKRDSPKYPALFDVNNRDDIALLSRCKAIRDKRNSNQNRSVNFNPGRKLIKCEHCGKFYYSEHTNYVDGGSRPYRDNPIYKDGVTIRREYADFFLTQSAFVRQEIYNKLAKSKDEDKINKEILEYNQYIEQADKDILKYKRRRSGYRCGLIDGEITKEDYDKKMSKANSDLDHAISFKEECQGKKDDRIKLLESLSNNMDLRNFQEVLSDDEKLSPKEVYDLVHYYVKFAYLRRIVVNGHRMTAFVVVYDDYSVDLYVVNSFVKNDTDKLLRFNFINNRCYWYDKTEKIWKLSRIEIPDSTVTGILIPISKQSENSSQSNQLDKELKQIVPQYRGNTNIIDGEFQGMSPYTDGSTFITRVFLSFDVQNIPLSRSFRSKISALLLMF